MNWPRLAAAAWWLLIPSALGLAADQSNASRWSDQTRPKPGPARVIGSYGAGCLQGAIAIPVAGDGFELLHPSRNRYYGHPTLVAYVRRLATALAEKGLPSLLLGDLSQPRGGPTPTGHASHQSGLDVDIAYTRPADALWRPLGPQEREALDFVPVVDLATQTLTASWHPRIVDLLELAASDPEVDRVFVSPGVKRELCTLRPGAPWLGRLRPWWGHHDHFHVRLRCPVGSPDCQAQEPPPPGDGCGAELESWFTHPTSLPAGRPGPRKTHPLPAACTAVLK